MRRATSFQVWLVLWSLLVAVGHVAWVLVFRAGNGIGLDEARLLPVSHRFADSLGTADIGGLARTWAHHEVTAPLLALVTAPFVGVIDDPAVAAPIPVALFAGLLVLASAELALTLGDRTAAVVTAAATSVGLGFVLWGRVHEQIVPGAALWVLALVLLLRSDCLRRRGWRWSAGIALGLALLVRAMLVGFVPVLLVLYALHCWRRGRLSLGPWVQLVGLIALVAASWWAFQWRSALGYLAPQGYDSGGFPLAPARWAFEGAALVTVGAFPLWIAVAVLIGSAVRAVRARRIPDLADPRVLVAVVAIASFGVLVTVSEEFPGFEVLVAPLVLALASSVRRPRTSRPYQVAFALSLVASLAVATLPGASWVTVVDEPASAFVRGPSEQSRAVARLPDAVVAGIAGRLPAGHTALLAVYDDPHFQNAHLYEAAARAGFDGDLRSIDSAQPLPPDVRATWPGVDLVVTYDIDGCTYQALDVCLLDDQLTAAGFAVVDRWDVDADREVRLWEAP